MLIREGKFLKQNFKKKLMLSASTGRRRGKNSVPVLEGTVNREDIHRSSPYTPTRQPVWDT